MAIKSGLSDASFERLLKFVIYAGYFSYVILTLIVKYSKLYLSLAKILLNLLDYFSIILSFQKLLPLKIWVGLLKRFNV